jgi:hypothetical protein
MGDGAVLVVAARHGREYTGVADEMKVSTCE